MTDRLAILAGSGKLPQIIQSANPDCAAISFAGVSHELQDPVRLHRFEQLGALFDDLRNQGVTRIVMAGAMQRPQFDASALDRFTAGILPDLTAAMMQGDDYLLRFLIAMIQDQGFRVQGAHEVVDGLTVPPGSICGIMSEVDQNNLARADMILASLAPLDIGQAVVIEGGQALGIETLQGTEFMLDMVAKTSSKLRAKTSGVLVKRPKPSQDLRADMPAIGPDTVDQVADAGLSGIVISPGKVMLIDKDVIIARALARGIFIYAQDPSC